MWEGLRCIYVTVYSHIPSCCCFRIFFCWASSAAQAGKTTGDKELDVSLRFWTETKTRPLAKKRKSVWDLLFSAGGDSDSRTVWSHRGQTVARHPEELPLCPCTATSCNLLLWDKTKLTRPFYCWPLDLSQRSSEDLVWQVGVSRTDYWSLISSQQHKQIKYFYKEVYIQTDIFFTLWYNLLFSHSNNFWIDRLVFKKRENKKF